VDYRLSNIDVVYPKGRAFPRALLEQEWKREWRGPRPPDCVTGSRVCRAAFIDLDGDGREEILLFDRQSGGAFRQASDQTWVFLGSFDYLGCSTVFDRLTETGVSAIEPQLKDIQVGTQRLRITPRCEIQQ
jgi:hypothetical protein